MQAVGRACFVEIPVKLQVSSSSAARRTWSRLFLCWTEGRQGEKNCSRTCDTNKPGERTSGSKLTFEWFKVHKVCWRARNHKLRILCWANLATWHVLTNPDKRVVNMQQKWDDKHTVTTPKPLSHQISKRWTGAWVNNKETEPLPLWQIKGK